MADPDKSKTWVYLPRWPWIALIWVATGLMFAKVASFDADLEPFRMADFELTFTAGRANQILTAWDAQPNPQPDCSVRCMAQRSLDWDDAFIPLYVVAIVLLVLRLAELLASRFDDPKKRWAIIAGYVLAACVIVAGLLDYIENWRLGALLQTPLGSLPSRGVVLVASWSALIKFALLGLATIFCIVVTSTTERARHAASLLQRLWMQVLLVLGVGIAFLLSGQAQDIIRGLADDAVAGAWLPSALFYAAIAIWSISGWYWSRFSLIFTRTPTPRDERTDPVALWLPRLIAAAGGALIGLAFEEAADLASGSARNLLYIGGLVALAVSVGAVAYFAHADKVQAAPRVRRIAPLPLQHASLKEADRPVKLMLWLGLAGAAVLGFGFLFFPVQFGWALGPGATLLLAVSVGLPVVGALEYVGYRYRISIALVLVALLFIDGTFDDSHKMRVLGSDENLCRASSKEKMQRWLDRVANPPPADKSIPMYLVATEGGGIRAAYWTASVLAQLADTGGKDFTDHLFAISAVSGGSLGSAVYAAELASPAVAGHMTDDVQKVLGKDFLSPTLGSLASVDLVQAFLPALPLMEARDRAFATERAFELAWERNPSPFEQDFLALWPLPEGASSQCPAWPAPPPPWVPSLFLNATYAEDGNRIITSDIRIDSSRFPDAHDTFDQHAHVRLSTATLLSARFPYVSPAASLPLESHAVDGGYFDNSGATTLSDLLEVIRADFPAEMGTSEDRSAPPRACHGKGTVCPTILIITNGERPDSTPIREFAQARIPPHAVLQTQTSRGYYAVDQLLREARSSDWRCVQLRLDNKNNALPLGWMLSKSAQDVMNGQARQVNFGQLGSASLPRCDEGDDIVCNCEPPPTPRTPAPPATVAQPTGP